MRFILRSNARSSRSLTSARRLNGDGNRLVLHPHVRAQTPMLLRFELALWTLELVR